MKGKIVVWIPRKTKGPLVSVRCWAGNQHSFLRLQDRATIILHSSLIHIQVKIPLTGPLFKIMYLMYDKAAHGLEPTT
jgi:hypothetical protein